MPSTIHSYDYIPDGYVPSHCNECGICSDCREGTKMLKRKDRENTSPIDDAGWFFEMLELDEEQLFTPHEGTEATVALNPLPREINPDVVSLAKELHIDPRIIGRCLPLLALPLDLQDIQNKTFLDDLKENETSMGVVKAETIARLRLIGDKDKAHKEMFNVWRKWGKEDRDFINEQVNKILETYKEEAEIYAQHRKIVEDGYTLNYGEISTHIYDELSDEECKEVLDILDMHHALHQSAQALTDEPKIAINFHGFDGNNETQQMAYTRFYIDELHRFAELTEIAQSTDYNSHYPTLRRYKLMLEQWNGCKDKNNLTRDEINRIVDVRVE